MSTFGRGKRAQRAGRESAIRALAVSGLQHYINKRCHTLASIMDVGHQKEDEFGLKIQEKIKYGKTELIKRKTSKKIW